MGVLSDGRGTDQRRPQGTYRHLEGRALRRPEASAGRERFGFLLFGRPGDHVQKKRGRDLFGRAMVISAGDRLPQGLHTLQANLRQLCRPGRQGFDLGWGAAANLLFALAHCGARGGVRARFGSRDSAPGNFELLRSAFDKSSLTFLLQFKYRQQVKEL